MSKFKIGDTIRRTDWDVPDWGVHVGQEYTVTALSDDAFRPLYVNDVDHKLNDNFFELVQAASEQPAVLTPLEVFQCILEGTPLEYSIKKLSGERTWHTVTNPKHIDLEDIECAEYRKKPTTVLINGISVPAPENKKPDEGYIYCVNLADERVIALDARYAKSKHYWSTEAVAQEVLDAIMTSFYK